MLPSSRTNIAALAARMMFAFALFAGAPAWAAAEDYRFEPVGKPTKAGEATLIRLRLIHLPDGKPVDGAILIQPKLEMGAGQGAMAAPVKIAPPPGPGLYAVEARPTMGGEWQLSFAAKIPGEATTLHGRITLDLVE